MPGREGGEPTSRGPTARKAKPRLTFSGRTSGRYSGSQPHPGNSKSPAGQHSPAMVFHNVLHGIDRAFLLEASHQTHRAVSQAWTRARRSSTPKGDGEQVGFLPKVAEVHGSRSSEYAGTSSAGVPTACVSRPPRQRRLGWRWSADPAQVPETSTLQQQRPEPAPWPVHFNTPIEIASTPP